MRKQFEEAKKLYFEYGCNEYYMKVDGVLEQYKRYNISPEIQRSWRNEYIINELQKLYSSNDVKSLKNVQNFIKEDHNIELLKQLYNYFLNNKDTKDLLFLSRICSSIVSSISMFMIPGNENIINKIVFDVLKTIEDINDKLNKPNDIFLENNTIERIKKILMVTKKSLVEISNKIK